MNRNRYTAVVCAAFFLLLIMHSTAKASVTQKGNLGFGGDLGVGGVTSYADGISGTLTVGTHAQVQYFFADRVAANFHFGWERYFYEIDTIRYNYFFGAFIPVKDTVPMDLFPFVFALNIYFPLSDSLHGFVGIGPGIAFYRIDGIRSGTETRLLVNMQAGAEYEVSNNLTLKGMVDILLPNISPRYSSERVMAFVKKSNPSIKDIRQIEVGSTIIFPPLDESLKKSNER